MSLLNGSTLKMTTMQSNAIFLRRTWQIHDWPLKSIDSSVVSCRRQILGSGNRCKIIYTRTVLLWSISRYACLMHTVMRYNTARRWCNHFLTKHFDDAPKNEQSMPVVAVKAEFETFSVCHLKMPKRYLRCSSSNQFRLNQSDIWYFATAFDCYRLTCKCGKWCQIRIDASIKTRNMCFIACENGFDGQHCDINRRRTWSKWQSFIFWPVRQCTAHEPLRYRVNRIKKWTKLDWNRSVFGSLDATIMP